MKSPLFCTAALVAAALALPLAQAKEKSYLVTVIPETGEAVTDLTAADFTVREDGNTREIIKVEHAKAPLMVSLVIDMSQPPPGMNTYPRHLRTGVTAFVAALRASSPGVKIEINEVANGVVTSVPFDAAPETLDKVAEGLFPAHAADAVMLLEAVGTSARKLAAVPTPRRAIVSIDIDSSEAASQSTMKRVVDEWAKSGATVWAASVRLRTAGGSSREGGLNSLTQNSGGLRVAVSSSTGLEATLKQFAASLASQYFVTYARPEAGPPKPVTMETKRGLKVRLTAMSR